MIDYLASLGLGIDWHAVSDTYRTGIIVSNVDKHRICRQSGVFMGFMRGVDELCALCAIEQLSDIRN